MKDAWGAYWLRFLIVFTLFGFSVWLFGFSGWGRGVRWILGSLFLVLLISFVGYGFFVRPRVKQREVEASGLKEGELEEVEVPFSQKLWRGVGRRVYGLAERLHPHPTSYYEKLDPEPEDKDNVLSKVE